MRFDRFSPLLRSTVFRLSLLNAALLVLALAGAGAVGWLLTEGTVEHDARERITIESRAIAVELSEEGPVRAASAINARSEQRGGLEYLLTDPHGRILAGDLTSAPRAPGWHRMSARAETPGLEGKEHLLVLASPLPDGSLLIVGGDLEQGEAVRDAVFGAILASGAITLLISLAIGWLVTHRVLRRMEAMLDTVRAVGHGDLMARVGNVQSPRGDLDELAVAINGMLDRIAALIGVLRRVSAEIAHDLRTPLTRMRHSLDAAKRSPDAGQLRQAVNDAGENLNSVLRLFEAMLDLAEIDSGEARQEFALLDIASIADQVVDVYRPEIEGSGRSIELIVDSDTLIEGDADHLTRAIANLVDNAFKHSASDAHIVVRAGNTRGETYCSVEDNGPGIRADDVATMLRPFGRLDAARTTPGNGLGLAIVDAVARLHGARLEIDHVTPGLLVRLLFPKQRS